MHRIVTRAAILAAPLAAGFIGAAVASADPDGTTVFIDPTSLGGDGLTITALPDLSTPVEVNGLPGVDEQFSQTGVFDDTLGSQSGTFDGELLTASDVFGGSNTEVVVQSDPSGDAPAVGSTFDTFSLDGFGEIYSNVPGTGFDAGASDIILTPLGDFALPPELVSVLGDLLLPGVVNIAGF
jgi:hypothetical protein